MIGIAMECAFNNFTTLFYLRLPMPATGNHVSMFFMEITEKDMDEVPEVAKLVHEIEALNASTALEIADEIFKRQPFFLTVLLGYRLDTTPGELDEIMRIYMLVWKYFRGRRNVQNIQITKQDFETIEGRHVAMLQYVQGERDQSEVMNIYATDLGNLKSKALLTAIFYWYHNRPVLANMDVFKRGMILVSIKSFIECFERL
jgi:hypothetical protein